ncbi:hypothetical protein GE061_008859 [Apolygus lucorum]|uniref:Uncharacterized protein n=1 Tax=Apolygus lucorum TaxID=248454 RepID=A0A6A4J2N6_APOLU|nr:hypothetical protein GE061_008859 [Apolygus lucorum]
MEKSGMNYMDNSINYAEGRNATPTAPPAYDEAMASAYNVHHSMGYEHSVPLTAASPQYPVNPNYPPPASYPTQVPSLASAPAVVVPGVPLPVGPRPIKTTCPSCSKHISSRTSTKNSLCCKFLLCSILALTVCCLPCACLPFCMCGPERVSHFCPKCNAHLGTWVNH